MAEKKGSPRAGKVKRSTALSANHVAKVSKAVRAAVAKTLPRASVMMAGPSIGMPIRPPPAVPGGKTVDPVQPKIIVIVILISDPPPPS